VTAGAMETTLKMFDRVILPTSGSAEPAATVREDEGKLRSLTDHIAQIVYEITSQGHGQYFNPYWENYTGLSERESLDFGWMGAFHREDLKSFIQLFRRPIEAGGLEFEARLRRAGDGSYRRHVCHCSRLPHEQNGLMNLLICCTDVEEWRKAEATAKEQGELLALSLRIHDEEKRRIAHGLHDSAGQYLVALQLKLDGLQRSSIGKTGCKNSIVDDCRELVKRCCGEIRAVSHLLYPPLLDDLGLESAVHLHVDRFMERTKAKVELDIEPNLGRLDRDLEIALFRVLQLALAGMERQSAGKVVRIKIGGGQTSILIEVAGPDGMDLLPPKFMAAPRTPSSVGLAALRQGIIEAGGRFDIGSARGGTVIRAVVPRRALVSHACD
jgi:PAS domain S-box-containing protein